MGRRFAGTRFVVVERGGTERELKLHRAARADLSMDVVVAGVVVVALGDG